jgi:hypothetical protein
MGFTQAIASGFRNYVKFSGRAVPSEFWFWQLFIDHLVDREGTPGYNRFGPNPLPREVSLRVQGRSLHRARIDTAD